MSLLSIQDLKALVAKTREAGETSVAAADIDGILNRDSWLSNGAAHLIRSASTGDVNGLQRTKSKMCLIQ